MARPQAIRLLTLSASYGAGGSIVAPRLAERFGLPFADRLILARGGEPGAPGSERLSEEERLEVARGGFLARLAHLTGGFGLPVPSAEDFGARVRQRVEDSIHELARTGGGVILGRGSAVVLADHPRAFHVRLDGPEHRRLARAMAMEDTNERIARHRLTETERARARYLDRLYGRNPADPSLYHLVVDTTVLSFDDCVDVVARAAEAFWAHAERSEPAREKMEA